MLFVFTDDCFVGNRQCEECGRTGNLRILNVLFRVGLDSSRVRSVSKPSQLNPLLTYLVPRFL